jgi:hypothetical protein
MSYVQTVDAHLERMAATSSASACLFMHPLPKVQAPATKAMHNGASLMSSAGAFSFGGWRKIHALPRVHPLPYEQSGISRARPLFLFPPAAVFSVSLTPCPDSLNVPAILPWRPISVQRLAGEAELRLAHLEGRDHIYGENKVEIAGECLAEQGSWRGLWGGAWARRALHPWARAGPGG